LVYGLLLPVGGVKIHFCSTVQEAEHFDLLAYSRGMSKDYENLKGGQKDPLLRSRDQNWPVYVRALIHFTLLEVYLLN